MIPAATAALNALRTAGVRLSPAQAGAFAQTMAGQNLAGIEYQSMADNGSGGCSGGGPFAGYAPAGLLTVGPLTAAGAQTFSGNIDVAGADLPPGSILVIDRQVGTAAQRITQITSDSMPQAIGQNGVGLSIANLNNQNAPGIYLALNTTRNLAVDVAFGGTAAIGDSIVFQILSKGGRSVQAQACAR
jgi:hypothetical protein